MNDIAIYKEIIKIINKITKFKINEIEEIIAILEKSPSYTARKLPLEKYFNADEINILKKIGSKKKLKELLELILGMKIIKECCDK